MGKCIPPEGGCWFCYDDSGPMMFSCEFDCNYHEKCLDKASSIDPEAILMRNELKGDE